MIGSDKPELAPNERIAVVRSIPFFLVHIVGLIGPFFFGFSWIALFMAIFLYVVRMFIVTGIIHRYFSHRAYDFILWPRFAQFMSAFWGTTCVQRGVLWWASHHRHHHAHSDEPSDVHSNLLRGFYWSHVGWIMCPKFHTLDESKVRDWMKYPELMWFEKGYHHLVGPVLLASFCGWLGWFLGDAWNTSYSQMMVWGFFLSTVMLWHGTFAINSLAHMWGKRRYDTGDQSKNSLILAIFTHGEGWHNNHHHDQRRAAQAVTWFEYLFDPTYWIIWVGDRVGIIGIKKR